MLNPRRLLRVVVFGAGLTIVFSLATFVILQAVRSAVPERPPVNLNIADVVERRLPELARNRAESREPLHQIVVLGDSTVVSYRPGHQVPEQVEAELARLAPDGPRIELVSLAVSGVAPFDYYFLADRIIAAEPDGVLFSFNLDTVSPSWRNAYSRPELAGLTALRRVPEAASLPLDWVGLTLDRLLFYVSIVQLGGFDLWYQLMIDQARVGRARSEVQGWADGVFGGEASHVTKDAIDEHVLSSLFVPGPEHPYFRFTEKGVLEHYRGALGGLGPDNPVLQALTAAVRDFELAGIPVFVYLTPVNVEHMDALGLLNREGLARTIAVVEEEVREAGGDFIDLHALLPDEGFRDGTGHFVVDDEVDGPARVAQALGEPLLGHIRQRVGAAR